MNLNLTAALVEAPGNTIMKNNQHRRRGIFDYILLFWFIGAVVIVTLLVVGGSAVCCSTDNKKTESTSVVPKNIVSPADSVPVSIPETTESFSGYEIKNGIKRIDYYTIVKRKGYLFVPSAIVTVYGDV